MGAAVTIVTYDSERYIQRCLDSLFDQEVAPEEIVIVDNASKDSTREILGRYGSRIRAMWNAENRGFAAAQNQAIAATGAEWVLVLNPDTALQPEFLGRLLAAAQLDDHVGTVCGKLVSLRPGVALREPRLLDSTGIYFTPALRHFDRGWDQPDHGQFDRIEYVFGASAAAAMYRRSMIQDVSYAGDFFDPDFFSYREDADVAWRAQLLGWRCLYTPEAVGGHVRRVTPKDRRSLPADINMHSVKNRFLLEIKNLTGPLWRRCWASILSRDLMVLGGCLIWEQSSLRAFPSVLRLRRRMMERRRSVMLRRRVSDDYLLRWFLGGPAGQPLTPPAAKGFEPAICLPVRQRAGP